MGKVFCLYRRGETQWVENTRLTFYVRSKFTTGSYTTDIFFSLKWGGGNHWIKNGVEKSDSWSNYNRCVSIYSRCHSPQVSTASFELRKSAFFFTAYSHHPGPSTTEFRPIIWSSLSSLSSVPWPPASFPSLSMFLSPYFLCHRERIETTTKKTNLMSSCHRSDNHVSQERYNRGQVSFRLLPFF